MRNSGAPASPRAALGRCPALRSSCLLHGVSSYPRGAPGAGRPARDVGVARTARMCVRRGGGRWALRESSLGSNDETRFLVSFWKAGCNADPVRPARDADASGHCAPRGRAAVLGQVPLGRCGPACVGWAEAAGRPAGPARTRGGPAARSRKLTVWSREGRLGAGVRLWLRPSPGGPWDPGQPPSFRPGSLIAEEGARCRLLVCKALEGRPCTPVGPSPRRVPRVLE